MTQHDTKSIGRGFGHDMSSIAILERLRIVNELYQLGKTLSSACYIGVVEALKRGEPEVFQAEQSVISKTST